MRPNEPGERGASCCAASCFAEQRQMTAEMVDRLVALRDAEPLPLRWALLQLVAGSLALAVEYDFRLPGSLAEFEVFADELADTTLRTGGESEQAEDGGAIWDCALRTERRAAAKALWEQLQEE